MKVLLCYQFDGNFIMAGMEPLGVIQLGRMLKERGHEVRYVLMEDRELRRAVRSFSPRLIGYSICSVHQNRALALNRKLKGEFEFFSLFGGPHPTFFPAMLESDGVDAICLGEADESFPDFVDRLEAGEDYFHTPNFQVKAGPGEIIRNPPAPLITDLNRLPYPDREGLYQDRWLREYPLKTFINSRGCPFSCTYCYNRLHRELYGQGQPVWRYRDPHHLVGEMEWVKNTWPLKMLNMVDDVFIPSKTWLENFVEEFRRRVNVPFTCMIRLDRIDEDLARLLAEAGCVLAVGAIESGDETIRREVLGRNMKDEQIIEGARLLKARGIKLFTQNMMGVPGETVEQALKTLELNHRCRVDLAVTSIFTPFPNLELTRRAIEQGYFSGDVTSLPQNMTSRSVLSLEHKAMIERLQKLLPVLLDLPWLRPRARTIIKLPLHPLYSLLRKIWMSIKWYRSLAFQPSLRAHLEMIKRGLFYYFQDR